MRFAACLQLVLHVRVERRHFIVAVLHIRHDSLGHGGSSLALLQHRDSNVLLCSVGLLLHRHGKWQGAQDCQRFVLQCQITASTSCDGAAATHLLHLPLLLLQLRQQLVVELSKVIAAQAQLANLQGVHAKNKPFVSWAVTTTHTHTPTA